MRGMVVGEGDRSSGVLLYTDKQKLRMVDGRCGEGMQWGDAWSMGEDRRITTGGSSQKIRKC